MKYWKHCDVITHTDLNVIVDAINALEKQTTDNSAYVFGCRDAVVAGTVFFGIHLNRWIVYRSTGEVRSMDYVPTSVSDDTPLVGFRTELPDCNEEFCMFDLHTVPWLKYGDAYECEGSEFALEISVDA